MGLTVRPLASRQKCPFESDEPLQIRAIRYYVLHERKRKIRTGWAASRGVQPPKRRAKPCRGKNNESAEHAYQICSQNFNHLLSYHELTEALKHRDALKLEVSEKATRLKALAPHLL
jgi:hypothetical protein